MFGRNRGAHLRRWTDPRARMEGAAMEDAMANALTRQPRYISYPDYKTKDDFPLWLSGFWAKIRHGYGYKLTEDDKVKAEIVLSISGKLLVGGVRNSTSSSFKHYHDTS